ncbi:MAG TPA: ROK family protein [Methylovirgula sp.]|nr:ROK family protein [Methylovirgula sp.]
MRIGVDLGGTKIEAIALGKDGAILARRRLPTPRDYEAIILAIGELVGALEEEFGHGTIGVAMPGSLSPKSRLIRNANTIVLNGKPFDRDLEKHLCRPVRLENDANCLALSEAIDGAGADASCVFGVILGTGVGGGLVIDRKLLSGRNKIAGEWGHNPMPLTPEERRSEPRPCYCGRSDCVETWLSGSALTLEHRQRTGEQASAESIAEAAAKGEREARRTVEIYAGRLARALAIVVNIIDPDAIVLGGGLSNVAPLYDLVPSLLGRHAFSDVVTTRVLKAMHGDSSGVRGAAWLWPEDI